MSELDGTQATTLKRPANEDTKAWPEYWKAQGQPWRAEPEIDEERQKFLTEIRNITSNRLQSIYPFRDNKLIRADIEWLLSTYENNRGPVDWNDKSQYKRQGFDLSGADLRGLDLSLLPLAMCQFSAAHLEGADLIDAHLEGATFSAAHLEKARFSDAHLEKANLYQAHLERADFRQASLEGAYLNFTHLERANLSAAHLEGANLSAAFFDAETRLNRIGLSNNKCGAASLCDIHWGDVNVAVVDWSTVSMLGDEKAIFDHERATRAYRQLSVALRNQGLNEAAARFTYRAQLMQRKVYWRERKYGQYLFSGFLELLSGYGYKPLRCFIAYLLVILSFALAYFIIGHKVGPVLSPLSSVVFSMTSFHGRGFFPGGIALDDPLTVVAAFEAFVGLLIEVTFIATLTQRLFGR